MTLICGKSKIVFYVIVNFHNVILHNLIRKVFLEIARKAKFCKLRDTLPCWISYPGRFYCEFCGYNYKQPLFCSSALVCLAERCMSAWGLLWFDIREYYCILYELHGIELEMNKLSKDVWSKRKFPFQIWISTSSFHQKLETRLSLWLKFANLVASSLIWAEGPSRGCLVKCLIFWENSSWHAYKCVN